MKHTLVIVSTVIITFCLAFATSLFLEWPLVTKHWTRQVLVILLMALELLIGALTVYTLIKNIDKK